MSRNYKFHNPEGTYFISFAVVDWIDVFTRNEYKNIILDSFHKTTRYNRAVAGARKEISHSGQ